MKDGLSKSICRNWLQTARCCCRSTMVVVNDRGKGVQTGRQVRIEKMSESKPIVYAPSVLRHCQNRSRVIAPGSVGTKPVYGPVGSRCRGGMSSIQALVWNVRTLVRMLREITSGRHHEEEYRCRNEGRSCP